MLNKLINSKFKKDILFSYFTQGILLTFGFLNIYLITSYAGIDKYGKYAILVSSVGFMSLLLTARSGEAIVKFYNREKIENNLKKAKVFISYGFIIDMITAGLLFLLTYLLSEFIAQHFLKQPDMAQIVVFFSIINVLYFLRGTMEGYLQANELFYFFNGLKIVEVVSLSIILIINFNYVGTGLIDIVNSYVLVGVITFVATAIIFSIHYFKEFLNTSASFSKAAFKEYIKFNAITFSSSALKAGNQNFDNLILSYFTNPGLVGVYTIIKRFFQPITVAEKPFQTIMYPKLTQLYYEKNLKLFNVKVLKITKLLVTIAISYSILVLIFSDFLAELFSLKYTNTFIIIVFIMFYYIQFPLIWWSRNFSNIINPMISLYSTSLNTLLQLLLCSIFTYLYGLEGLVVSLILVKLIIVVYWIYQYKKNIINKINEA